MGGRWRSTARRVWKRSAGFGRRRWKWLVVPVAVIAVTLGALDHLPDEPLRARWSNG